MKLNRRNALLVLGTIAASGGTAIATGAFSSLSADRTVTINTASDAEAVISLRVDDSYTGLNDDGSDVIELNFSELNENATTTFTDALTIENNGSETIDVTTIIEDEELDDVLNIVPKEVRLEPDGTDDDEADFTLNVNLRSSPLPDTPAEITFGAERVTEQ